MDMDGVYAQVIYGPPLPLKINDRELKVVCMQAYNDWAAEFNTADPDRLCVLAQLTAMMPNEATREMQRVAELGHRGAVLNVFDSPNPVHDGEWESLWAMVEESGLPLSFHLGGGTNLGPVSGSWELAAFVAIVPMHLDEALASMIFCGALERHPKMKLVLGESGIGWIPYLLERMDLEYRRHTPNARDYRIETLPSELFANQVYATFQEDRVGMKLIDQVGVDNVMWASDYPHPDSTFPNSIQAIEEAFRGLNPGIQRKVTRDTAAKLYGITGTGIS
jgi:predicted TIM-barrel fold metal-dependent hydrolase